MTRAWVEATDGLDIAYEVDDFSDGWTEPETVVCLHGIAESTRAFAAWVPTLARTLRTVRVDLRGYGASAPIDEAATLDIEQIAADVETVVQALGARRVHLVGAKLGAQAALVLAQRNPEWLASVTLAGVLISPGGALGRWVDDWIDLVDRGGVVGWARATMPGRMGACLSPDAMDWWSSYMGTAPASTVKACFRMLPRLQEPTRLESIACPLMLIATTRPAATERFNQTQPRADIDRWLARIPTSRLCEIEADSYHVAATHPDACARATLDFIREISTS